MTQGDALTAAAGATMALVLVSRGLRRSQLSLQTKVLMALAWAGLIAVGAWIASYWPT